MATWASKSVLIPIDSHVETPNLTVLKASLQPTTKKDFDIYG